MDISVMCKDLDHLFIICGTVHASCISRNPFKALYIHVNHKTFQVSKTLFFLICKKDRCFSLRMIISFTANRKPELCNRQTSDESASFHDGTESAEVATSPELCTYTPITYSVARSSMVPR